MTAPTDVLIEQLATQAHPVKPLAPPSWRALAWLACVGLAGAAAVLMWADLAAFWRRNADPVNLAALFSALATGVAAIVSAYHLSLPDRSRAWALAPAPFLAAWLATSGYGCLALSLSGEANHGDSRECLVFILATSTPMAALLFWRLRLAQPLRPRLVATVGALGAASLSAVLLQFFHGFDVTWLDLGVHMGAVLLVVCAATAADRLLTTRRTA